jgi:hypothetical protein
MRNTMQSFRYEKESRVRENDVNPRATLIKQARGLNELISGLLNDCTGRDIDELSASLEYAQDVLLDSSFIAKCEDCENYMHSLDIKNDVCALCDAERMAEVEEPFRTHIFRFNRE